MSDALFPIHILIYVIIFVAVATYMIVFNLNTLVGVFSSGYESQRAKLVQKMKSEAGSDYWQSRGAMFENFQFRPKAEIAKPGEWILIVYAIKRAVVGLGSGTAALFSWKRLRNKFGRRKHSADHEMSAG
jgi:hypothetical protein